MRQGISVTLTLIGLVGCASGRIENVTLQDVRTALTVQYPFGNVIHGGELQFDERFPVIQLELPALAKALPDVRFFITYLHTGYYEYPVLEVAVAAPSHSPIALYYSPSYSKSDPAFTRLLTRARVADSASAFAVAEEITSLFSLITSNSDIRNQQLQHNVYSAELWNGNEYSHHVSITFANGRVSSVVLTNQ